MGVRPVGSPSGQASAGGGLRHRSRRVLEAACGTGALWAENVDRLPTDLELVLTDFSIGMVASATAALADVPGVSARVADVQHLPFADNSFDHVICNHALYHVPDRPRAVAELCRVLRSDGVAAVATNGRGHLRELDELRFRHLPDWPADDTAQAFGPETGEGQLATAFGSIGCRRYDDELRVTEVAPMMAFVLSTPIADRRSPIGWTRRPSRRWRPRSRPRSPRRGAFVIAEDSGVFICT
ncbi:MAG: class I SAM-dependent methyltransferase [Acidimicrobiia bacterium]|nr:class I SAM-dependent methyltransferase [Acidimicrobiia bacterium]